MLDFVHIEEIEKRTSKEYTLTIQPEFEVNLRTKDLMVRGGDFYAVYDEETCLWSKDEQTVIDMVDEALKEHRKALPSPEKYDRITVLYMRRASSGSIDKWHKFVQKQMRDNFKPLDEKLVYQNTKVKKTDYVSMIMPYALEAGDISSYQELFTQLFDEDNLQKLEWAVGACVTGDSKHIEKCVVLYGAPGTGKGTYLNNVVQNIFEGHTSAFNAKRMSSLSNTFALDSFKDGPLVSIQPDGDLSKIEDNTLLNSVISHEILEVNPKYGRMYTSKFNTFLFLGTNKPVKITDSKSGLLRRIIDVHPTGNKIPPKKYRELKNQLKFEIGAIAYHCAQVYKELGEDYFDGYVPLEMMEETNNFFNFMEHCYDDFVERDHITLIEAWKRYCEYCEFAGCYRMEMKSMSVELKSYFREYQERGRINGQQVRRLYSGFRTDRFTNGKEKEKQNSTSEGWLELKWKKSIFEDLFSDWPAQYEKDYGKGPQPEFSWSKCKTKLCDLDTTQTHYTKPPEGYPIVMIDFDLKDEDGNKSLDLNLAEARKWPKTYAELSKSGSGIHLYYYYDGDLSKLRRVYIPGIEIKVFIGNAAIRRKLIYCNDSDIATMPIGGLPTKGEKKVVNWDGIKNEKMIRTMIKKNLNKEYHADTTSSIDYIKKILDDAYESGINYDVSDLTHAITMFAMNSTNQAKRCVDTVAEMKFKSDDPLPLNLDADKEAPIIFLDCEVFPNLLLINWKYKDSPTCVHMINPTPEEVEALFHYRIVGFNNRKYDNHILYARSLGYNNDAIYQLSNDIINNKRGFFREAYNISYTDVYDFASKKQGLKKWEIELGIHHQELGYPWDKPIPEDKWHEVSEYCDNDVIATEAVFDHCKADFLAREILAALAGGTVNETTNQLSLKIIFGNEKKPTLVYTDLATGEQSRGR